MTVTKQSRGRPAGGFDVWRKVMAARPKAPPAILEAAGPCPPALWAGEGAVPDPVAIAAVPRAPVNPRAPMAAADLVFGADGRVAWGEIWEDFCELALIGGPPHRGTLLEAPDPATAPADPEGVARVREEIGRGLAQTTGWPVVPDVAPGWIGLRCPDEEAAAWMALAILAENVDARQDGATLLVPAGPAFTLKGEIKNVVTAVAKAWHFWARHGLR